MKKLTVGEVEKAVYEQIHEIDGDGLAAIFSLLFGKQVEYNEAEDVFEELEEGDEGYEADEPFHFPNDEWVKNHADNEGDGIISAVGGMEQDAHYGDATILTEIINTYNCSMETARKLLPRVWELIQQQAYSTDRAIEQAVKEQHQKDQEG